VIGAIAGDIIGSVYELNFTKSTDFPLFSPQSTPTDDTVLTIDVADYHIRLYLHSCRIQFILPAL
jgi:ADP-ribosylglycohydrolase